MKRITLIIIGYLKGFIFLIRPHIFLGWLRSPFLMSSNILSLSKWISQQDKKNILNDFYSPKRDYLKRYKLYSHVIDTLSIKDKPFDYLEFGVFNGDSLKWWATTCSNPETKFYGFDTFEGLPENWGTYKKGEMSAHLPVIDDTRVTLIKGLFQNSVPEFLSTHNMKSEKRKIVHLDADLFSSTLFALTSLAIYLKKGDVLMFDEFNVPNHEYYAFKCFCESYYIKTKLIGAVNNYYQIALMIT